MENTQTANVHHGLFDSWIDYDRSWLLRRQVLVSEYQASILSNLVAVALTLAGPRLWILIKALLAYTFKLYERVLQERKVGQLSRHMARLHLLSHYLRTTEESHSELGAARDILADLVEEVRPDRIHIPTRPSRLSSRTRWLSKLAIIWANILRHPVDISISLGFSIILVGIFVAESTGGVMSGTIVSDTIALASSTKCAVGVSGDRPYAPRLSPKLSPVLEPRTYSQQCYHADSGSDVCNYFYNQSITYTEHPNDFCPFITNQCALGLNGAHTFDTGFVDAKILGINSAKQYQFRRRTTCSPLLYGIDLRPPSRPRNQTCPLALDWELVEGFSASPSRCSIWGAYTYNPRYLNDMPAVSILRTAIHIKSYGAIYAEYRGDPVFPAKCQFPGGNSGSSYYNNEFRDSIIHCAETAEIRDPDSGKRHMTEAELAYALLSMALMKSSICQVGNVDFGILDVSSRCVNRRPCYSIQQDQWLIELRRWFEASLAIMQIEILQTVRGTHNTSEDYENIPPAYRGICKMGKFRSVGWRNVSVWGLSGLLLVATAVSLASVRSEKEELWLIIGTRGLCCLVVWAIRKPIVYLGAGRWSFLSVLSQLLAQRFKFDMRNLWNLWPQFRGTVECINA